MKIVVLFTGLLRKKNMFLRSLSAFRQHADSFVKILFSTWESERPKLKDLESLIDEVVYSPVPPKNKYGKYGHYESGAPCETYIWNQMYNYEVGVKRIREMCGEAKDIFVLKTRTDVYVDPQFILDHVTSDTLTPVQETVLSHKIWVPWVDIAKPFYMADECFLVHANDMDRFYNYKHYGRQLIGQGIDHMRRFVDPFISTEPVFRQYMTTHSTYVKKILTTPLPVLESNAHYLTVLKRYYEVLEANVVVLSTPGKVQFRRWNCCESINIDTFGSDTFADAFNLLAQHGVGNLKLCYKNSLISELLQKLVQKIKNHT